MDSGQLRPRRTPQSQLPRSHSQPSTPSGPSAAWGQPDTESDPQEEMQTQDWVSEPPERRRSGGRWSVSIEERRRLAVLRGRQRRDASGDIMQMVAELVSEDVDRDVLLLHSPRSAASTNAFHDFLARSTPSWPNATLEAQTSRSPPS